MVFTVEPGIYFVPSILARKDFRERFRDGSIDFERAESLVGFGGIRIEDDIVVIADGPPENLSDGIPKAIDELEHLAARPAVERPDVRCTWNLLCFESARAPRSAADRSPGLRPMRSRPKVHHQRASPSGLPPKGFALWTPVCRGPGGLEPGCVRRS